MSLAAVVAERADSRCQEEAGLEVRTRPLVVGVVDLGEREMRPDPGIGFWSAERRTVGFADGIRRPRCSWDFEVGILCCETGNGTGFVTGGSCGCGVGLGSNGH
jgi:hypothetical protein